MKRQKPLNIAGKTYAIEQRPLVCSPLIASNTPSLLEELGHILPKKPDMLEWRLDYFQALADVDAVIDAARQLKLKAGDIPLLLTRRAQHEGGEAIALSEEEVVAIYSAACKAQCVDLIDYELSNPSHFFDELCDVAHANGIQLIGSYHNFQCTPATETLTQLLGEAQKRGADFGKVAVMPQKLEDVLTLLDVTLKADQALDIPVITISMGPYGSLTRMIGGAFGSSITFAVGAKESAPGQISIEDVHQVLDIVNRSTRIV